MRGGGLRRLISSSHHHRLHLSRKLEPYIHNTSRRSLFISSSNHVFTSPLSTRVVPSSSGLTNFI
ncbi:hypothetical protein Tco_0762795, partial [Tanacetum coccineum]